MFFSVKSIGLSGLDGYEVNVEANVTPGLFSFEIVGLPDTAVKESRERVLSAIKHLGFTLPTGRVIINLAPANTKKEGAVFDLPIAIALLGSMEALTIQDNSFCFLGELSLNGNLNLIPGVLPMTISAREFNIKNIFVPLANSFESAIVSGINVLCATSLIDVIYHLTGKTQIQPKTVEPFMLFFNSIENKLDFSDVKGQKAVKRAFEIAASGGHNLLLIGSPGSGKTMLAKRLPTILPDLTFEESLEVTKIYSISGLLSKDTALITKRPFRSPHHTISTAALIGGGKIPHPGEISLSHHGVLFLDELPEFQKNSLEVMRQPLEEHEVNISRVNGSYTYPANFMLIASMNPCPCGYFGSTKNECKCTAVQIRNYLNKISGPLLDRIDIQIEVPNVKYSDLEDNAIEESSSSIKSRVDNARKLQIKRYSKYHIYSNSELTPSLIKKFCILNNSCKTLLKIAFEKMNLSARAYSRILKVSRTIADLDFSEDIKENHIAEAIQYRNLDRQYF